MPIVTGSNPKALVGGMGSVTETSPPQTPLYPSTLTKMDKPPRKPPKIKKKAFGPSAYGAAFKK